MTVECARCGQKTAEEDLYHYRDQNLCEDCYMGALQAPKTCDVAATQMAKKHRQAAGQTGTEGLLEIQKAIVAYLDSEGKATREQLAKSLNIPDWELEKHVAILRHCELVKGRKINGKVYLVLFDH
jgi:recombinational DNA repair protein (RecF pathway)